MATSQRRLSAILHAHLAGFVRMTEGQEELTFTHLKSAQAEVWRPAIEIAGGSLVNSAGDAMLAEFGSALAAVAAAIDIQERMARFNERLDQEQRLMFRIGVHLGEVIVDEEGGDIFGDGVNLAERRRG
jgi:adenylate cyclase